MIKKLIGMMKLTVLAVAVGLFPVAHASTMVAPYFYTWGFGNRSEERRVGKEC